MIDFVPLMFLKGLPDKLEEGKGILHVTEPSLINPMFMNHGVEFEMGNPVVFRGVYAAGQIAVEEPGSGKIFMLPAWAVSVMTLSDGDKENE